MPAASCTQQPVLACCPAAHYDNSNGLCRLRLEVILVCSLAVQLFEALVFELTRNKLLCRQEMVSFTSGRVAVVLLLVIVAFLNVIDSRHRPGPRRMLSGAVHGRGGVSSVPP